MTVPGHIIRNIAWLLLFFGLTGCSSGPPPLRVEGVIEASHDVNYVNGEPSQIVVKIYQLRSPGFFLDAEYYELYTEENATLGQNLLAPSTEFILRPRETRELDTEFDSETQFIGVVAAYLDWENAHWRELVEVPEDKANWREWVKLPENRKVYLGIKLKRLAVSVSTDEP